MEIGVLSGLALVLAAGLGAVKRNGNELDNGKYTPPRKPPKYAGSGDNQAPAAQPQPAVTPAAMRLAPKPAGDQHYRRGYHQARRWAVKRARLHHPARTSDTKNGKRPLLERGRWLATLPREGGSRTRWLIPAAR